jgi:hypothetical protein
VGYPEFEAQGPPYDAGVLKEILEVKVIIIEFSSLLVTSTKLY